MSRVSRSIKINASCDVVFNLIHDYRRRLEWDSMLREARLLGGAKNAAVGVRSVCKGTWRGAFLSMETEYVSFEPGKRAAVKLVGNPPFFERFAATILHKSLGQDSSETTYIYNFRAKPRWLRPVMNVMLKREVEKRLVALKYFLERG